MNEEESPPHLQPRVKAKEIAALYQVTERAVFKWKDEGRIPHIKIGKTIRFNLAEVIKAIESPAQRDALPPQKGEGTPPAEWGPARPAPQSPARTEP